MSTYSVFATLRLRLFACSHNLILSKSSLSPNSISSIIFPLTVKLVSSQTFEVWCVWGNLANHQYIPKRKVGPKLNPEGLHKILFLDQIVYPSSTLYSKCFLEALWLVHLISAFTFHFRSLCLIRTTNVCPKKVSVLWSAVILPSTRRLYKKEERVFPYRMDDLVLPLNMPDGTSFNGLLLISLPRSDRGW